MIIRRRLRLPEGYTAKQVDRAWHLADPRGALLFCYPDATTVEIFAWRHVWQARHEAFEDEPDASRAGDRRPSGTPRDAAEAPPGPKRRPHWFAPVSWPVVAAAAAGALAGLVVGLGAMSALRQPVAPSVTQSQPTVSISAHPELPGTGLMAAALAKKVRVADVARYVPEPRYAVTVGSYTNPAAADRMKHVVRSKGYIVDVVRRGAVSQVVTRLFRTRAQAERVARAFEEIRLPAHLTAWRAI